MSSGVKYTLLCPKDVFHLFEGLSLGLGYKEDTEKGHDTAGAKKEVDSRDSVGQKERDTVADHDGERPVETVDEGKTFGTRAHVEDFGRVHIRSDTPREGIHTSENVNKDNDSVACVGVLEYYVARLNIDDRVDLEHGTHNKHADPHSNAAREEEILATPLVNKPLE